MRWLGLLLWFLASTALAEPALHERVAGMLSLGIETRSSPDAMAALGPEVVPVLIALFEDASRPRHVRLRALSMLADLDDARATAHFEALLRPGEQRDALASTGLVARRALEALTRRERVNLSARELAPLLAHREENVRHAAVALSARLPALRPALEARLPVEPSKRVRKALEASLTGRFAVRRGLRLVRPKTATPPR